MYVQSFPPSEGKWQVSADCGMEPSWPKDGKELCYTSGDKLIAMDVKTETQGFEPGLARPLFVNLPVESSSPVTMAINWAQGRVR